MKGNMFSNFSRNSFLLMEDRDQKERKVENSFLLVEDRAQRERRVVRRGTYSVVSHETVSF